MKAKVELRVWVDKARVVAWCQANCYSECVSCVGFGDSTFFNLNGMSFIGREVINTVPKKSVEALCILVAANQEHVRCSNGANAQSWDCPHKKNDSIGRDLTQIEWIMTFVVRCKSRSMILLNVSPLGIKLGWIVWSSQIVIVTVRQHWFHLTMAIFSQPFLPKPNQIFTNRKQMCLPEKNV